MRKKDKPWFNDDSRRAFDLKEEAHLRWTLDHSRLNWDELNAQCPHKWLITQKSAVFSSGSDSSLHPLIEEGGSLVCESVGKADMLSVHFDGKESKVPVDLSSTCHPSPSLTTFAFRPREVKRLLLDKDSYGGTDPLNLSPIFLRITAEVLAPRLSVVFRRLLRFGSFPVCWRVDNVTSIPKSPPSSLLSNYRPISLTPILPKVFEQLVSVRLGRFME